MREFLLVLMRLMLGLSMHLRHVRTLQFSDDPCRCRPSLLLLSFFVSFGSHMPRRNGRTFFRTSSN